MDISFSSNELTLSLDDFSDRIIQPAISVLAANIEADAMSMYKDVYNQANNVGTAITNAKVLDARRRMTNSLAPMQNRRLSLNTQDNADFVDAVKGLFQDSSTISEQYVEGLVGRTAGFGAVYENTLWPAHTSGSEVASTSSTLSVNGGSQTGSSVTVTNGSSKTLKKGDIVAFAGCYRVHPESKTATADLHQFTVTADVGTSDTSIPISPSIVTSGATQNCSASPTTGVAIQKVGTASTAYGISMAYHQDAFAFSTADLVMPKGVDFAAREMLDGISMRVIRAYDINNDLFPCRIDVLYGYKTIRAQMACRLANN